MPLIVKCNKLARDPTVSARSLFSSQSTHRCHHPEYCPLPAHANHVWLNRMIVREEYLDPSVGAEFYSFLERPHVPYKTFGCLMSG
jgi:hypothetical protein